MSQLPRTGTTFEVAKEQPKVIVSRKEIEIRSVKIPVMANTFEGYFSNRVDITLTSDQAKTLKSVLFGLQSKYTKLANGKEIANGADVFKWILETVA
jgi:hypothetical protein